MGQSAARGLGARVAIGLIAAFSVAISMLMLAGGARAANDFFVQPFEPGKFTKGLPTDADSVRARKILANANEFALTTWYNVEKDYDAQAGTYLTFGGTDEPSIRRPASEAYSLATALATGGYDAAQTGVSEATARSITLKLVRSLAFHHISNGAGGWGNEWQTSYWAALAGAAGWMMWGELNATDREYVRKMVEYEANRFIGWPEPYWKNRAGELARGCDDTAAEESSWMARLLYLASDMMPRHSRRSAWTTKAEELAIGAFARPADLSDVSLLRGRAVSDWLEGTNINNDGSLVNHNRYHPDYMTTVTDMATGGMTDAMAGKPMPVESLHGTSITYDAVVDKSFWPAPAKPCSTSPAFLAPGAGNPTGTIYVDNSHEIYYPEGWDWGPERQAAFYTLDTLVNTFGLDSLVAQKAATWEDLHGNRLLANQERPVEGGPSDGRAYRSTAEDSYAGREEWVAVNASEAWLYRWLNHQEALTTTNSSAQIVLDDHDRNVSIVGSWTNGTTNGPQTFGPTVHYKPAGTGSAYVRFDPRMSQTATYDVYAWWVQNPEKQATNAPYTINYATGTKTVTADQTKNGGKWMLLGTFAMGPGDYVQLSDNANGYVAADAILLDPH